MIFKKDNFLFGIILGLIAPLLGILLFKFVNFNIYSFKAMIEFMLFNDPGYKKLTVALTLSLLLNALLFTIYINSNKDKTAKGIFVLTVIYGLLVLIIKTFA